MESGWQLMTFLVISTVLSVSVTCSKHHERNGHHHHPRFSIRREESESLESFSLAVLIPGTQIPESPLSTFSPSHYNGSIHRLGHRRGHHRRNHDFDRKYPQFFLNMRNNWAKKGTNSTNSHKDQQDKRKLSWKRSRKTRRHEKLNAFHGNHRHQSQQLKKIKEPFFDKDTPSIVTSQLGSHAFLSCKIHDLEDKSVSWIRNKDAHILTIDRYTFISDSRFVSWFDPDTETWTLQVKFTRPEDAGRYECQVSTEPKRSHFVTLSVVVPLVVIPGGAELHVRSGSDVMLKCVISKALTPPPYVFWYHDDKRIPEERRSGGIVRQTPLMKVTKDSSVASLSIENVDHRHAGNYTCAPAGLTTSASVLLHVLNGEHPAAMQHGSNAASSFYLFTLKHQKYPIFLFCIMILHFSL